MKNQQKIELQRRVLVVKSELIKIGINGYPKKEILKHCPFKTALKVIQWNTLAQNVWHLRSVDESIVELFEKITNQLK